MPISKYNADGTVDIFNTKTGEVRAGIFPEELSTISPKLTAEYQKGQSPESVLSRKTAESEIAKLEGGTEAETFSGADSKIVGQVKSGLESIKRIKETLGGKDYKEGEGFKKGKGELFGATTDLVPFTNKVDLTPFGRGLESDLFNAVDIILRQRSGAAVTPEELRRYVDNFGPKLSDTAKVREQKIKTIEGELIQTIESMGLDPKELLKDNSLSESPPDLGTTQDTPSFQNAPDLTGIATMSPMDEMSEEPPDLEKKMNPIYEFFLGTSTRTAQDLGTGLALSGETGDQLQQSQDQLLEQSNKLFDKADELESTDPDQAKKLRDMANNNLKQIGFSSENIQNLFSEDIDKSYTARGLETGVEIGGTAASISSLINLGNKFLGKGGQEIGKEVVKKTTEKAVTKEGSKDLVGKVVKVGEKIEQSTPKSFLGRKQAEAAKLYKGIQPKVDTIKKFVMREAVDDPDIRKLAPKYLEDVDKIKSIPRLLQKMESWGRKAFKTTRGIKASAKADVYAAMYRAGTEILKSQAPEVAKYRSLLRFSYELPKAAGKFLWRATLGKVIGIY